jgi:hypothetical protein
MDHLLAKSGVGPLEDKSESVIATARSLKIGLILRWIEIFQEQGKVLRSKLIVVIESLDLRPTHNSIYLCAAYVIRGESKDKVRV